MTTGAILADAATGRRGRAKCIRQRVPTAQRRRKFRSSLQRVGRCTARIAIQNEEQHGTKKSKTPQQCGVFDLGKR
ncbi:MAG: hypothetical protein A2934_01280 [Candidatus Sungbacteria bacterium RIFCSPLOWO2_01_FULL_47_10]|uniref:Uncharacterized protein n=1 Tax=Candidatus Sungbacteria bacterium RIFCSPLOWO2_01_FULL_47_10 TaxID=1802276 RepID=A0A1G2KZU8_9BACT|nr:MAG: hypothetical protein A2934_01280 [Candidatus Sungbacteria bacterium RIFCSPLOWO2_01_FULL_47_10]